MGHRFYTGSLYALAVAIAICGSEGSALAQGAPASTADAEQETDSSTDEILVTGTRIGRNSFNAPTPVNIVGAERVENLGITNVADALNQLPGFRPLTGPSTNSFRGQQNIAGRTLDLRGLGAARTLTLIDGRRVVPSGDDNTFDLNALPSIMIERSEVVTGGASAAYGADAVSGVVNLIMDKRYKGIKGELSKGISEQGDATNLYAALKAGTDFADGKGHIVVGGEYSKEGSIRDFRERDWSRRFHNFIPNPFFNTNPALSNGLPANVSTDNVLYALNPAGVISVVHPLQGNQFDASGNLVPFQFGELFNRAKPSALMVGGDPSVKDVYGFNNTPLLVANKHVSVLGHAEFEFSDALTLFGELAYAKVNGGPATSPYRSDQNGALRIRRDNAFMTPATAAAMDAVGATFLPLNRSNYELGGSGHRSTNETWRANVGLQGKIGGWRWDTYYDYGKTSGDLTSIQQRNEGRWQQAVDAVFAPAGIAGVAAGSIVCRSTLTNPANGCVPINVMGPNTISAAGAAWVTATAWQTRAFEQHHVAANVRGTLFNGWAGEIAAAFGVEYRVNTAEGTADANSIAGVFSATSWSVLPKTKQKVTEAYAEVNVPLLRDSPLGKSLEVDAAVRQSHYSQFGDATTWKVGAVYELNDDYMLRVTRSRDIRAPSPLELNPNVRSLPQNFADPKYNLQYVVQSISGGNPDLGPETANTFTVGAVLQPHWLPRFRLSVDYYDIKVSDAIDQVGASLAVQLCREGSVPDICRIGTDVNGNADRILEIYATYQNVSQLRARGIEFVSSYSAPLAGGEVDVSINGNYIDTLSTTAPNGAVTEFSNVTGNPNSVATLFGVPKWRADAVVTYSRPTWSLTSQFQYIPKGILNRSWIGPQDDGYSPYLPNSVSDNRVAARLYVNLNGRLKVMENEGSNVELFFSVKNLFDRDPPRNLRYNGNPVYFDPIGRNYRIGIRGEW